MWVFVFVRVSVCFEAGIRTKTGLSKLDCFQDPEVEKERGEMREEEGRREEGEERKPRAVP